MKHAGACKRVHTFFVFVCAISLGACDLELRFVNKRATSLPGDDEVEYILSTCIIVISLGTKHPSQNTCIASQLHVCDIAKPHLVRARYILILYIQGCSYSGRQIPPLMYRAQHSATISMLEPGNSECKTMQLCPN